MLSDHTRCILDLTLGLQALGRALEAEHTARTAAERARDEHHAAAAEYEQLCNLLGMPLAFTEADVRAEIERLQAAQRRVAELEAAVLIIDKAARAELSALRSASAKVEAPPGLAAFDRALRKEVESWVAGLGEAFGPQKPTPLIDYLDEMPASLIDAVMGHARALAGVVDACDCGRPDPHTHGGPVPA